MKKLLILALASAFVAAANADNWFSVAVSGSTPTTTGAEWSTTPAAANSVISIDEDVDTALALTPIEGNTAPAPQVKTVVTVEATFTAVSDSLETLTDTDAKTALTVQNVNNTPRYRYWDGNGWEVLNDSVVAVTNAPVEITIELDNDTVGTTTVAFKVVKKSDSTTVLDESVDLTTGGNETYLRSLAFAGTGSLTSVAATVTPAYAKYNNTRYATTADAVTAKGNGTGDITLYAHNNEYDLPTEKDKVYYTKEGQTTTLGVFPASGSGAENSPYEISNLAELKAFQQYVDKKYTTANTYFQQTDDITLDAAWPGIGIQNGKDLATGNATEKGKFDAGAFKGTYDGGNHTVSNFQMVDGLDYCGFFNSVSNATIRNLKISYKDGSFAKDMAAANNACGATFVGVAKGSTLQGLTSLAGTVSCTKGFGGIVGYLMGTTVDSCTNNLNMTSLAGNKCGGIAMICQKADCSIRNCKNTGTMTTTSGEHGGIIGYTDTITISDCENTAACKMFYHHGGAVTLSGTNKGNATVASYTGVATPGLNFATVSGDVATFVADNALDVGNTYKVMAAGVTATATLATKDSTISFDTALVATDDTKPTFNITAGSGLVAKSSTSGTVTTYTAGEGYEVVSTAETTLVAVPKTCTAATLIDLSNRAEGDVLKAYNTTDGFYYTWRLSNKKAWEIAVTYKVSETDSEQHSTAASDFELKAGQAVWLTRTSAASKNAKIILAVVADPGTMKVDVSKEYNLVAPPPSDKAYDAKENLKVAEGGSFDEDDQIVVPTSTAPLSYTRKDGAWKVLSGEEKTPTGLPKDWGAVADPDWAEPSKIEIPSGQGFWFYSKKAKKLEF